MFHHSLEKNVSGNDSNKIAPEYLKVLFPRLNLGFWKMNVFTPWCISMGIPVSSKTISLIEILGH